MSILVINTLEGLVFGQNNETFQRIEKARNTFMLSAVSAIRWAGCRHFDSRSRQLDYPGERVFEMRM